MTVFLQSLPSQAIRRHPAPTGVNLEGMKYDDWPVARLIEREISRPLLLTRYRRKVARSDKVTVLWARDAWQYSARPRIKEADLAPTPIPLDRLDGQGWEDALRGARECLNPRKRSTSSRLTSQGLRSSTRGLGEVALPNTTVANDSVA